MRIGEKTYPVASIHDLSLTSTMLLQRELATVETISSVRTWADVLALTEEMRHLTPEEASDHPESVFLLALTVWACRVTAGERVSLIDAGDVPMDAIEWIPEPGDRLTDRQPKAGGGGAGKVQGSARRPGGSRTGPVRTGGGKKRRHK